MYPLADIWDALGGGVIAALVTALAGAYVLVFRARSEVQRDERNSVIDEQRKYMTAQAKQVTRLQERVDELESVTRRQDRGERRCQRRVDRLRLIARNHSLRLGVYEAAMREAGLPTLPDSGVEIRLMLEDDADEAAAQAEREAEDRAAARQDARDEDRGVDDAVPSH